MRVCVRAGPGQRRPREAGGNRVHSPAAQADLDRPPGRTIRSGSRPPPPARTPKRCGRASSASGRGCRGGCRSRSRWRSPAASSPTPRFHHAGKKTVPDLTGQTLAQAQSALQKAGLALAPGTQPTKPVGPAKVGKVIFQIALGPGEGQAGHPGHGHDRHRQPADARPRRMRQVLRGRPAGADGESSDRRPGAARDGDAGEHRRSPTGCSVPAADPTKQVPFGTPVNLFMQSAAAPVRVVAMAAVVAAERPFHHWSGCPSRRPRRRSPAPG